MQFKQKKRIKFFFIKKRKKILKKRGKFTKKLYKNNIQKE